MASGPVDTGGTGDARWQRVNDLFHAALARPADDRHAFLVAECGADTALRRDVESLLAAHRPDAVAESGSLIGAGVRVGDYEISGFLAAGAMGEVYHARDVKLGRDVALKILPAAFVADRDRRARFEREARLLAALNHPNIATIYGFEEGPTESGHYVRALALELVDGETLADRIARGKIPVDEALRIARQIADALEAAHEQGIIHRDLKPANITLTGDGLVKVLDFGLAKLTMPEAPAASMSPLMDDVGAKTAPGVLLGSPAYMSPEQARGQVVDKRTDIWAFGCVLYEMFTGRAAFPRASVPDTFAAILERDPEWSALPEYTPAGIRQLLKRCLEKDRKRRLHDIADAGIEIDDVQSAPRVDPHVEAGTSKRHGWIARIAVGLTFVALIAALMYALRFQSDNVDARTYRASIVLPEGVRFSTFPAGRFALSPDGRRLAFAAMDATGKNSLWVRSLDTTVAQQLAGTEGAEFPFWSPDSRHVAFQAQGKLKRIDASGGPVTTLCDASTLSTGAWNRDDVILFTPKGGDPLHRVSALGGTPVPATTLDTESGDAQHWYPFFLPDGRHFLYFVLGSKTGGDIDPRAVYVGSLDGSEPPKLLLQGGSNAKYAEGHLVYLRGRTLIAQPFDTERLELRGSAVPLAEQVQIPGAGDTGTAGAFSVADTGALVYQTERDVIRSQLIWFDRSGRQIKLVGDQADYAELGLSTDSQRAIVSVLDPVRGTYDLWSVDVDRGVRTRLTSDPSDEIAAVWSPDRSQIIFASSRKGGFDIYSKQLSGAVDERPVLEDDLGEFPESSSPDGRFLMYGLRQRHDEAQRPLGVATQRRAQAISVSAVVGYRDAGAVFP